MTSKRTKTVAIIQARMRSTRLPGKVLRSLCGRSVLGHVIARVRACDRVDEIVVATSTLPADDEIEREAVTHGASVFRGSEHDVLARHYDAATRAKADIVARITSDCPLFDPGVLHRMLAMFLAENAKSSSRTSIDYLSNTLGKRTFPRGLDAEVFTITTLGAAHANARDPWEREHVTPFIYAHPESFRLEAFRQETDESMHRWTLDTEEDWRLIKAIYEALGGGGAVFSTRDVIEFLSTRPDLMAINAHVPQKQPAVPVRR